MCAECGQYPCNPRCPNAPEEQPIYKCCECGGGIYAGDHYIDGRYGRVCEDCVSSMTALEILDNIGEYLRTAY